MNKMVCSIELILWMLAAMAGIGLGIGFFASGLIGWLSASWSLAHVLSHQFLYAAIALTLFRLAMLRIDHGWSKKMLFHALAIAALIVVYWVINL